MPAIAAASDLKFALEEVRVAFQRETGHDVRLTFGASGQLTRQIEQGAPFELFLSADEAFVERLANAGLTKGAGRLYAIGRLALWVPKGSTLVPDESLRGLGRWLGAGGTTRLAIANPETAPYGRAAKQALQASGLWQRAERRLVIGENVAQAAQYAASGNAAGALIAHSLALAPDLEGKGTYTLVSDSLHAPLRQRMVLLKRAGTVATRFHDYLNRPAGQAILARHGFSLPVPAVGHLPQR